MPRKVKTHTLNGHLYDIDVEEPFDEVCESPKEKGGIPSIRVAIDINTKKGLIALLHGILHAEKWAETEEVVERTAEEGGTLIWRLGYRRQR